MNIVYYAVKFNFIIIQSILIGSSFYKQLNIKMYFYTFIIYAMYICYQFSTISLLFNSTLQNHPHNDFFVLAKITVVENELPFY